MSSAPVFTITYWGVTGTQTAPLKGWEVTDKLVAALKASFDFCGKTLDVLQDAGCSAGCEAGRYHYVLRRGEEAAGASSGGADR